MKFQIDHRAIGSIFLAAIVIAGVTARAQSSPARRIEELVRQLPAIASGAARFEALETSVRARTHGLAGVTVSVYEGTTRALHIEFATPIDAARAAQWLGIERPYAISGDVDQTQWEIVSWAGNVADPFHVRIATRFRTAGTWIVRPVLVRRPAGALPREVAGASPAYDLQHYAAEVRAIEITWAPDTSR